ncbi:sulfotransferase family protein [Aegicerativicinus sediminis]|uniref:sulfotransferase family protein n=1 Tax=Aegicerativicinus sediminis TaxID=2893202 RepID=UPI001E506D90|nr:sulfotransferase family protein [Aegicerativicinus sediminis]
MKIFVIGFHKTGTTSLELALNRLGFNVYGGDQKLLSIKNVSERQKYIKNILKQYNVVQDMPWPLFYKELYEMFPDSKFILTYRSPEKWIKSVVQFFAGIKFPLHQKIYGVPCAAGYEDIYLHKYNAHNQEVLEFFNGNSNFLVMEAGKNFDYGTLCGFLEVRAIPSEAFPHGRNNSKRLLPKFKWYRQLRSYYWNLKKGYN